MYTLSGLRLHLFTQFYAAARATLIAGKDIGQAFFLARFPVWFARRKKMICRKISQFLLKFKCNIPSLPKIILSLYSSTLIKKESRFSFWNGFLFSSCCELNVTPASSTTSDAGFFGVEQNLIFCEIPSRVQSHLRSLLIPMNRIRQ